MGMQVPLTYKLRSLVRRWFLSCPKYSLTDAWHLFITSINHLSNINSILGAHFEFPPVEIKAEAPNNEKLQYRPVGGMQGGITAAHNGGA
jgi:hypothetical protein